MVSIKSAREIALMKEAGKVVGLVFKTIEEKLHPGMSTLDIDEIVETTMLENGCLPSEKGYYGYPASACVSVNDTLLHGIPSFGFSQFTVFANIFAILVFPVPLGPVNK